MRSLSLFVIVVSYILPACTQYNRPAAIPATNLQIETLHRASWLKPLLQSKKISYQESGVHFITYTLLDERQLTYMGTPVDEVRCETNEDVLESLQITLLQDTKRSADLFAALQKQFGTPVKDTADDFGEPATRENYKWENDTIRIILEQASVPEKSRSAGNIHITFLNPQPNYMTF